MADSFARTVLPRRGHALAEAGRANLHEGRWYLRTRSATAVTIERFRMLPGVDYETGQEVKLSPPGDAGRLTVSFTRRRFGPSP